MGRELGLRCRPGTGRRAADGWLAFAYNTTPERFSAARARPGARSSSADGTPKASPTRSRRCGPGSRGIAPCERVPAETLAPVLRRDPGELGKQVCVGPAEHCAQLLARYAEAGCVRVYLWPLGDEPRQLELIAAEVAPLLWGNRL